MPSDLPATEAVRNVTFSTSKVAIASTPDEVTLSVSGELDMADADQVGEILAQAASTGRAIVRVDLSAVTFADSSAIKALLLGAKTAEANGVEYELVNAHGSVQRLLAITGLTDALNVVSEPDEREGPNSL